jgi:hypothetical protein
MSLQNTITRSTEDEDSESPGTTDGSGILGRFHRYERELWVVVIAAMGLDILSTVYGLSIGLQEQNPVARQALNMAGVFGLAGLKGLALAVGWSCFRALPDQFRPVIPLGLAVPSLVATGINVTLIGFVVL